MATPDSLLEPVSADRPCGDDLEYDADFLAMQQAAQGRPERAMGDQVIPAEEPNWKAVRQLAQALSARTKDLRVVVPLCRALLHTDGFRGLQKGLGLLGDLCARYWPDLYPQLDAEDDGDPTMRVNCLLSLCGPATMLKSVREAPLVRARVAGSFSLRDTEVAAGRQPPPLDGPAPSAELIRAAFQEVPLADLQADAAAVQEAQRHLDLLARLLDDRLGGRAPDLQPLGDALAAVAAEYARQLEARGAAAPQMGGSGGTDGANGGSSAGAAGPAGRSSTPGASMHIQSREDVIVWIDRMCEFYRRTEPSSPVPILLQRARNLVNKSFLDVIRDLVPDALSQAEAYGGNAGREE